MKRNESIVCRHVEQLSLRKEIEDLAKNLMNQIDMPVVFEINYQGDRNYGRRHPVHHNQFWVQIQPQEDRREFERLVLYLLYMGIIERRRVRRPVPLDEYRIRLENISITKEREARIGNYQKALNGLFSLATSMEADLYLRQYGIETSRAVQENKFLYIQQTLKEYISLQKVFPNYQWFKETQLNNLIDIARTCWLKKEYYNSICGLMKQIKPKGTAKKCMDQLDSLVKMLDEVASEYEKNKLLDVTSVIVKRTFEILNMSEIACLKRAYGMKQETVDFKGRKAIRCAFIPEDTQRKEELVKGLRYLNTGLLLAEEYYRFMCNRPVPDPHVSILISEDIQGTADGNKRKGYHITITTGLILLLYDQSRQADLDAIGISVLSPLLTEEEIRDLLFRYALFYIVCHEYMHIFHGDCDKVADKEEKKRKQERAADKDAKSLVKKILPLQYRHLSNDTMMNFHRFLKNKVCDEHIFMKSVIWCDKLVGKV